MNVRAEPTKINNKEPIKLEEWLLWKASLIKMLNIWLFSILEIANFIDKLYFKYFQEDHLKNHKMRMNKKKKLSLINSFVKSKQW